MASGFDQRHREMSRRAYFVLVPSIQSGSHVSCFQKNRSVLQYRRFLSTRPSAVVFDLGGVVLGSPMPAIRSFENDAGLPAGAIFKAAAVAGDKGSFYRLERGELNLEEFLPVFSEELAAAGLKQIGLPLSELFQRMEQSFIPQPKMITAIRCLKAEGLKTAALTNNWIGRSGVTIPEALAKDLFQIFDVVVESARCGMRKPDPRIYELVCTKLKVSSPEKVVFLDDMGQNLKAAKELGMTTIKVEPGPAGVDGAIAELEKLLGYSLRHFVPGTVSVRKALQIDPAAVSSYISTTALAAHGKVEHLRQFGHGQSNPTYHVTLSSGHECVLRKKPPGKILKGAHAVEREFTVLRALGAAGLPVPRVHALCEDERVLGTPFYLMDFARGRLYKNPALPGLTPAQRRAIYDAMNAVLAALHRIVPGESGLADYGRAGGFYARQIATWSKQYEAARTDDAAGAAGAADMASLQHWLSDHVPPDGPPAVVHGDFRLDNLIFADGGAPAAGAAGAGAAATPAPARASAPAPADDAPRVMAILDWELSTLGDPIADLAYNCLPYHLPPTFPQLPGLAGRPLPDGVPTEEEYVRAYCARTGRAAAGLPDWHFYMAFAFFRVAAILQGVYKRALQGNASSDQAKEVGRLAAEMAAIGWRLAQNPRHIPPP